MAGRHRSFVEVHLAKSLRRHPGRLRDTGNYGYSGPLLLSQGKAIGLRMIPMERDLRFAWEETVHQPLDEQAQKACESLHAPLIAWARQAGEGSDYRNNIPTQRLHPIGHWYEIPNLLRSGALARLEHQPKLHHVLVHNIDTVGMDIDRVGRRHDRRGDRALRGIAAAVSRGRWPVAPGGEHGASR